MAAAATPSAPTLPTHGAGSSDRAILARMPIGVSHAPMTVARQVTTSPRNGVIPDSSSDAQSRSGAVGSNTVRDHLLDILYEEQEQIYRRIPHPF